MPADDASTGLFQQKEPELFKFITKKKELKQLQFFNYWYYFIKKNVGVYPPASV